MNLTTHTFGTPTKRQRAAVVEWTVDPTRVDPADNPAWAVWESACGEYRVVFDGTTDTFSPQRRRPCHVGIEWVPTTGNDYRSLEAAQAAASAAPDVEVHHA
jgi:hypothetical protein